MRRIMKICLVTLSVLSFFNLANGNNLLTIKPQRIEIFSDGPIFAIDNRGKYQIGSTENKWSTVYDIQDKGLSLLDVFASTESGLLLIGSETRLDKDKSIYYTGLIVLIDSENKTLKKWHYETSFLGAAQFKTQLTLTTFNGIYDLNIKKGIRLVKKNNRSKHLVPLYDKQGNLITCEPRSALKNTLFLTETIGCIKGDKWKFNGLWYRTNETYNTDPLICGPWLIEPVQYKYKSPIIALKVRDIQSGKLIKEQKVPETKRYFCVNDSVVMLDTGINAYSLPDMKPNNKYTCNNKKNILSIKNLGNKSICLTADGFIGTITEH